MKPKQLFFLLVVVVVLGALGLYVRSQQKSVFQKSTLKMGEKLLGDFDPNNVAEMRITSESNVVSVAKKNDTWVVRQRDDYPANFSSVSELVQKLWKMKITEPVKVGAARLASLDLVPPGKGKGTLVELLGSNGQLVRTLLLGKQHVRSSPDNSPFGGGDWPDGRYVMVGNDAKNIALVNDPLSNLEPKPDQWLDKDFFKVEKVRAVAVAFPNATNSWKLTRETESGEWKLADAKAGEQLDNSKASGVANPLGSPSFADVVTGAKFDETGTNKPTVITVETFDNFAYTLKAGEKTNENYQLAMAVSANLPKERSPGKDEKPEDKEKLDKEFKESQKKLEEKLAHEKGFEKWVYLVSSWTVDPLLKERSQLLAEKKDEPKKDEQKPSEATGAATNGDQTKPAPEPGPKKEPE
jgi:hypothetical protein